MICRFSAEPTGEHALRLGDRQAQRFVGIDLNDLDARNWLVAAQDDLARKACRNVPRHRLGFLYRSRSARLLTLGERIRVLFFHRRRDPFRRRDGRRFVILRRAGRLASIEARRRASHALPACDRTAAMTETPVAIRSMRATLPQPTSAGHHGPRHATRWCAAESAVHLDDRQRQAKQRPGSVHRVVHTARH